MWKAIPLVFLINILIEPSVNFKNSNKKKFKLNIYKIKLKFSINLAVPSILTCINPQDSDIILK